MIQKAMQYIENLVEQKQGTEDTTLGNGKNLTYFHGKTYDDCPMVPEPLSVHALASLVSYINENVDKNANGLLVIVENPTLVRVYSDLLPVYEIRPLVLSASPRLPAMFPFGKWLDYETFVIALQARFAAGFQKEQVLDAVSGVRCDDGTSYHEDGVSQNVLASRGVSLKTTKAIPNPVVLAPFRTFPEIEQPESQFILRVTDVHGGPELGLFEADGGAWEVKATERIASWLREHINDSGTVILG